MKKIIMVIILFLLFSLNVFALNQKLTVTLNKCVDGDTAKFILNDEIITIRFLAIDTPESVDSSKEVEPYALDASKYTCQKLTNAKNISILYDNNSTKEDKYGRTLAWVFVDDELLNNLIVRNGYGKVAYLYGDYLYTNTLKDSEKIAQEENLGIWSEDQENNEEIYIIIIIVLIISSAFIFKKDPSKIFKELLKYIKKQKG